MEMPKHTDEAKAHFRTLMPEVDGVEVKPMFGAVGGFVNGNMFAGLFGESIGVKLDESGLEELKALPGSTAFGPAERPMSGWWSVPGDLPDADVADWVERARAHIATLPPKVKKPAKKAAPKK